MYIRQYLLDSLVEDRDRSKVKVILGPRRVGKTTLLGQFQQQRERCLLVSGEDIEVQNYLSSQSIEKLKNFVGQTQTLIIDEGQKIPSIGLNLKLLIDHCEGLELVVTGSSAFDLANHVGEPLTGRKKTFQMYPLSQMELAARENLAQTAALLEQRLLYGAYPEVILSADDAQRKDYLNELVSAYLYRDILDLEGIRKADKLIKLLRLLAFQIGGEVSHSELGSQVGLNTVTVGRYLDLLEKCFVIYRLGGFSRNLRKEVTKTSRYYFFDLGVRNALINQFNPLDLRNDVGMLWENYLVMERLKKQSYQKIYSNNYFWRTYSQDEIDWIEEREGKLWAYEMKWNPHKGSCPALWKESYSEGEFEVIHPENYLKFIT